MLTLDVVGLITMCGRQDRRSGREREELGALQSLMPGARLAIGAWRESPCPPLTSLWPKHLSPGTDLNPSSVEKGVQAQRGYGLAGDTRREREVRSRAVT